MAETGIAKALAAWRAGFMTHSLVGASSDHEEGFRAGWDAARASLALSLQITELTRDAARDEGDAQAAEGLEDERKCLEEALNELDGGFHVGEEILPSPSAPPVAP